MTEETIFVEAIQKKTLAERLDYLADACGSDAVLRNRVDALIASHEQAGDFLTNAAMEQADTVDAARQKGSPPIQSPSAEKPGNLIGRYKLLQEIGEGGFGTVFLAQQEQPVRRTVALKIIKLGMDTKSVIARFEAERQALAMMDHPNIAKVFDAGATDTGRPYFVMELVKGEPITEHADQNLLTIPQRLDLFAQVCNAVQHAHQKGIIHRDIKPRNVLVSTQDGLPFAKVIDFGIAKAISAQLAEKTLFTEFKQLIGTPQYMSPEQADGSLDIDTRTDIYSLGVLLYELLTGTTPFGAAELRSAAYDEMRRIIREDEPPKPSTRLRESTATIASVAALRHSEPSKLDGTVRGDLDWIVMKALEKNRGRRYATPGELAADVQRYLGDEAVHAAPPSAVYKVTKFCRRHQPAVITGTAIAITILSALIASSVMYGRERSARQQAELARQNERTQREQAETNFGLARDAVSHLTDIAQNRLMDPSDLAGVRRDILEDAAKFYETFAQVRSDDPAVIMETARANTRAGMLRYSIGQPWQAETHEIRAIALVERLYNAEPNRTEYQQELGNRYIDIARLYQWELVDKIAAERAYRRAKDLFQPFFDSAPEDENAQFNMYWACIGLASDLTDCDREAEALVELQQALTISEHFAALAPNDLGVAGTVAQVRQEMGYCASRTGDYAEAEANFRASILIQRRIHVAHPEDEWTTYQFTKSKLYLGGMLPEVGRPQDGEKLLREALVEIEPIAQRRSQYALMVVHLASLNENLGDCLFAEGRFAEAHTAYILSREALRRMYEAHTDAPGHILGALYSLALCPDESVRDPAAAASIARVALQRMPRVQRFSTYLGVALYQTGDWTGAIHALETAQQIGPRDLGFARYILALAQFKSGQPDLARASLAQAEVWATTTPPHYHEPRSFAVEARQLILGNAKPAPATPTTPPAR